MKVDIYMKLIPKNALNFNTQMIEDACYWGENKVLMHKNKKTAAFIYLHNLLVCLFVCLYPINV